MTPTPDDLNFLRGLIRAHKDRDPARFNRLDPWVERCTAELVRQVVIFRILAPGVWQIGTESSAPVYRDAPRALAAAHAAIAGPQLAHAAEFVARKARHPDNALRNALQRSVIPWTEQRCPLLAYALRHVGVRRSGELFYAPPRDAPRIVSA